MARTRLTAPEPYARAFSRHALVLLAAVAMGTACGTSRPSGGDGSGVPGTLAPLGDGGAGLGPLGRDPVTCAEAAESRSYVGCDYWPTVTANNVFSIFDYAVVVSNTGETPALVTVTGAGANRSVTVQPGALETIYLPWVSALKGPDALPSGEAVAMTASVLARKSAYHLVADRPVIVYQFSPLEYQGKGGPPGKSWDSCPSPGGACFSFSNDASLLLPSTAWTKSYRVTGIHGWSSGVAKQDVMGSYAVVTASVAGTHVSVALAPKGTVLPAGAEIPATSGGGTLDLTLDAGDVAEILTPIGERYDLSGSLVTADQPIQVMTGTQCIYLPKDQSACDHVEESVVPAEALGRRYVVTTPNAPSGRNGLHVVRFYGNRDGTTLTYVPQMPPGCPTRLNAGDVAECTGAVNTDFLVEGTAEFGVSSFQVGSSVYDASGLDPRGDPSQTSFAAIEQFRTRYIFLAPTDYDVSYAVMAGPKDAAPIIDGLAVGAPVAIDGSLAVWRWKLGAGRSGAHTLTSTLPVGLQVMGYGAYTSYQYPGGLNLTLIAPPPVPPR